jgi:ribonuclease P protein component
MNPPQRLGFPRRRRISRSSDFNRLKEEGRREVCGTLILNWLPSPQLRLGIVTSRNVGPATIRSRARRLLREVFRQHQHQVLEPVSMVLVARRSIAESHLETVRRDYLRALSRARLIKAPPATPASTPATSAPVVPPPVVR